MTSADVPKTGRVRVLVSEPVPQELSPYALARSRGKTPDEAEAFAAGYLLACRLTSKTAPADGSSAETVLTEHQVGHPEAGYRNE